MGVIKPIFSIFFLLIALNIFGQNDQDISTPSPVVDNDKVFTQVDQRPRFPGCEDLKMSEEKISLCAKEKLVEFVHSNVKYPEAAKIDKVQGTVIIQFIVDQSGMVINGRVVKDLKGHFDAPIRAMLEDMPNWIPGKEKGVAVNVSYTLPVIFRLPIENALANDQLNDSGISNSLVVEEVVKEFATDFEMTMEDGSKKKLSDFKGQVVYLNFWASWCGPCIKGFNTYRSTREDMEKLGVVILNVSMDEDREKWKEAITKHQPTGLHALVSPDDVRESHQIYKLPVYEIIGKNGQFLYLSDKPDRDILEEFKQFTEQ